MKSKKVLSLISAALLSVGLAGAVAAPALAAPPGAEKVEIGFDATTETLYGFGTTWQAPITVSTTTLLPMADVMFVVDDTGSMGSYNYWVKDSLNAITAALNGAGAADINFGIAVFDDLDYLSGAPNGLAYNVVLPLGAHSLDDVAAGVDAIPQGGGGDTPEDAAYGAMQAVATTSWRAGAGHYVVLITDAPTKLRDDVTVGGQTVSVDGLTALLTAAGAHLSVEAVSAYGLGDAYCSGMAACVGLNDLASATTTVELSDSQAALESNVEASIVAAGSSWTVTPQVDCVYQSDGVASTDLVVTIAPASLTLAGGESGSFLEKAVTTASPNRWSDPTVCTVSLLVNGAALGTDYTQQLIFDPAELIQVTRTIHYVGAGAKTPADVVQTLTWYKTTDTVSGAVTYFSTAGFAALASPNIRGYAADLAEVPATAAVSGTPTAPTNSTVTVTYKAVSAPTGGTMAPALPGAGLAFGLLGLGLVGLGLALVRRPTA